MVDESVWKRRFLIQMGARLFGLVIFFAGVAVMYSDVLREGGWPQVGAIIAMLGAIDALLSPRLLRKQWDREDRGET